MLKRLLIASAALAGIAATLSLGAWQWGRAQQRIALHEAMGFTYLGTYREVGWKMGAWRDVAWYQLLL